MNPRSSRDQRRRVGVAFQLAGVTSLGIAMVIPGSNSIAMFLGGLLAWMLRRRDPAAADRIVVPVSSGLIAGESLMGVAVALLIVFGVLAR